MKQIVPILLILGLSLAGCKEIGPNVQFGPPSDLGDRVVIIEEFTGAQCVFCPQGTEELENLLVLYPDNLAVISIHTGFFATPIPNKSKYDFRTPAGDALNTYLGTPDKGYPSSIINRKQFPGETSLHNVAATWAGYLAQEVALSPKVGLNVVPVFDPATRKLSVTVNGIAREAISAPLRVTVLLTESGIIDYQKDIRFGDVPEYIHKHVLRNVLNANFEGDIVAPSGVNAGQTILYNTETTLPEAWKADKMEVVAIIANGNSKYVYQAAKKKVE
ncbi:MAG: Omp28-related outer membrane protein [Saprospiraceae bacterium]|nr:Omp28-related outer membrane protein [Saprospiraceae bacterium]